MERDLLDHEVQELALLGEGQVLEGGVEVADRLDHDLVVELLGLAHGQLPFDGGEGAAELLGAVLGLGQCLLGGG